MKTVALISGGKDSCFNMMCCVAEGHNIIALANLRPSGKDELDSYMYQTVGHHAVDLYAEAMNLPIYSRIIQGSSHCTSRDYFPQCDDEVEDLFALLSQVKREIDVEAVSVGAILSDYQRIRVENVCHRLNLTVLSYLWRREQEKLLAEIIACDVKAIVIKVAALGLTPKAHLGLELSQILPHMKKMKKQYGLNECGEGGEYETFVLDCPLFKKSLIIDEQELVIHSNDAFAPVAYLNLKKCHLKEKSWDDQLTLREKMLALPITTSSKQLDEHLLSLPLTCIDGANLKKESNESELFESGADLEHGDVLPHICSNRASFQIAGIKAIVSESVDVISATQRAMDSLMSCVQNLGYCSADIVSISLYVRNMSDFAAVNSVYSTYFKMNPPVRLCIQACLPLNVALQIDCQGWHNTNDDRKTMHVQALSHWAPASIGPYSQAIMVRKKLFLAGMVPLLPSTLAVIDRGIDDQCKISLLYVSEVLKAMCPSCSLESCPMVVCFIINPLHIAVAKEVWDSSSKKRSGELQQARMSASVQYVVVPRLPKDVLVEWQVYAWSHSDLSEDLQSERLIQSFPLYTITLEYHSIQDFFSCSLKTISCQKTVNEKMIDLEKLAHDVLAQYSFLQDRQNKKNVSIAKIFFPSQKFTFSQLTKAFSKELSRIETQEFPALSFIPVLQLETEQHLLVWCQ